MTDRLVTLQLSGELHTKLQRLADEEQTDPVNLLAYLVETASQQIRLSKSQLLDEINSDPFLKALEPLIRRVVREELTVFAETKLNIFYLEPDMPIYDDMEEIIQRKAQGDIELYSHQEVWHG